MADAFRVLGREHLGKTHVREGERQDEIAQALLHAVDVEVGLAEVRLRLAGVPNQVEETLSDGAPLLFELGDVVADRGLAAFDAVLVSKSVPNPTGGVALLAPGLGVLIQPALDDGPVVVEHPLRGLLDGELGAEVRVGELRVDGGAGDAGYPGNLGDGYAILPHLTYRMDGGHADHAFLTSLADLLGNNQVSRLRWSACLLLCSKWSGRSVHFYATTDSRPWSRPTPPARAATARTR